MEKGRALHLVGVGVAGSLVDWHAPGKLQQAVDVPAGTREVRKIRNNVVVAGEARVVEQGQERGHGGGAKAIGNGLCHSWV